MPVHASEVLPADHEALEAQITELAAHIHAATYRLLTLIAELDRREIWADHGCRSPGCAATRFVEGHHVKHWAHGGETKLDNLVTLCGYHHRLVHEGGFGVEATAGEFHFFNRPGVPIIPTPAFPRKRLNGEGALIRQNRESGLQIDAETGAPRWGGETMDCDVAIHALFEADGGLASVSFSGKPGPDMNRTTTSSITVLAPARGLATPVTRQCNTTGDRQRPSSNLTVSRYGQIVSDRVQRHGVSANLSSARRRSRASHAASGR